MKIKIIAFTLLLFAIVACNTNQNSPKGRDETDQTSERMPYTPFGLHITHGNWHYKYARIQEFEDFTVTLSNKTIENFKMVKYRIKLFTKDGHNKNEVFSKSFEYFQRLNAGDMIRIPVYELGGFYMGVNVSDTSTWTWTGFVEDSEPIK